MQALSGDIPATGDIPGHPGGGREGVSSHWGKVCPLPTTHKPASQGEQPREDHARFPAERRVAERGHGVSSGFTSITRAP